VERSTLAWFRAADPDPSNPLDDTALLIAQLRATHRVDVFTTATAHNFVWRHFRKPYDLCVYELRSGGDHEFIPAYLVHYPGIVVLRVWPRRSTRRLLHSARLVVTPHSALVETLLDEHEEIPVRYAPPAVAAPAASDDIVVALEWPPSGDAPTRALGGMAAGKPVIVFETAETADWPALNPQTWQPRGMTPPIVVSIDPRDEEHSLKLAMRRLSSDAALREQLGTAAREWWMRNATLERAVEAWTGIIAEARARPARPRSDMWQPPLDGSEKARDILSAFGVSVDLF
jgi:hypothetical protein